MPRRWMIWLLVAGIGQVSANQCDFHHAKACQDVVKRYESFYFPFYGHEMKTLNDTCNDIDNSLKCMQAYDDTCQESEECDKNCEDLIAVIRPYLKVSGFPDFRDEMCDIHGTLMHEYLEEAECLERNMDKYGACHNQSKAYENYLHTTPGALTKEALCCFILWFKGCFINVTMENCGQSAIHFVTKATGLIFSRVAGRMCSATQIFCEKPPVIQQMDMSSNHVTDRPDDDVTDKPDDKTHTKFDNSADEEAQNNATTLNLNMIVFIYIYLSLFTSKHIL